MDKIAKQRLNVIVIVDCSKSMQGERIKQVNTALRDIKTHLVEMQNENSNVNFYITVITFSTVSYFLNGDKTKEVENFTFNDIKGGGWSNLHEAYIKLEEILKKESKGGIMPDFGGVAPILLLMTDGHPTKYPLTEEMNALRKLPWFNVALRYGIAIELNDKKTNRVLQDFVNGNGDVIECFNSQLLQKIIQIIILTASKVKSKSRSIQSNSSIGITNEIKQQVQQAISEVDDWEW